MESSEEQLSFLQQLDGEAYLAYTLLNMESGKAKMRQLVRAWRCADKAALEDLLVEEFETLSAPGVDLEQLEESLLDNRNLAMAERIAEFLESGSGDYFVTIGMAHYVGEESIIQRLREKNYTVVPMAL